MRLLPAHPEPVEGACRRAHPKFLCNPCNLRLKKTSVSIRQIRVRLQSVFPVYQVSEMKDLRDRKICVLLQSKNSNDMEQTVDRTVFNEAQLALLNAFSSLTSEKDLLLLKQAISEFFAKRADEEMEKLWESGEWNQQTLEDLRTAHYRTPYKK